MRHHMQFHKFTKLHREQLHVSADTAGSSVYGRNVMQEKAIVSLTCLTSMV